jgi:hypothetical protein
VLVPRQDLNFKRHMPLFPLIFCVQWVNVRGHLLKHQVSIITPIMLSKTSWQAIHMVGKTLALYLAYGLTDENPMNWLIWKKFAFLTRLQTCCLVFDNIIGVMILTWCFNKSCFMSSVKCFFLYLDK